MKRLKPVVLSVEDDAEFRRGLESVLSRMGLIVKGVSNSKDCLDCLPQIKPDLILVDLQLGKESGLELIQELRQQKKVRVPIVVISGARDAASISHALELGADDYVVKPPESRFLASKLSQFFLTEELEQHRSAFLTPPTGNVPARLRLNGEITEVDELGVRITGGGLVPKGSVIKLKSELFKQIGLASGECMLTVTSTELDPSSGKYSVYAEFDGVDTLFLEQVRNWLLQKG